MPASIHHLILGGQRSGKSRHAERLGRAWLNASHDRGVVVLATATPCDAEMQGRIARHRADRPAGFETLEEAVHLGHALRKASKPGRMVIVDCLTLWLANVLMPKDVHDLGDVSSRWPSLKADLLLALEAAQAPVVLVSNEIGMGVIPMGEGVRHFVDELGWLHQDVVRRCGHITLMAAGQPFTKAVEVFEE
jgi:adenosylcobinamide kinase/adenosylcobinamide-phosphate guanylyltransferase